MIRSIILILVIINLIQLIECKRQKGSRFNGDKRSTCLSTDCVDKAVSYLKLLKDKIGNYDKQLNRMKSQNKTGKNKAGKKGIFGSMIRRLVRAGGGNASNMACSGNSTSSGAETLKNLTSALMQCEANIKESCDTSNLPQPDMTKVSDCMSKMSTFKSGVLDCMKKTGSEACSCWQEDSLGSNVDDIKKCDLSKQSKSMAKAVSSCRNAFGACRKLEDSIGLSIHACTQDKTALIRKLKTLKKNKAALNSLKEKLSAVVSGTKSASKATQITCSSFTESVNIILNLITENPSSGKVSRLILKITVVTVVCSATEKASLSSLSSSIQSAEDAITQDESSVQSTLSTLTGTTASSSIVESSSSCEDNCDTAISITDTETISNSTSNSNTSASISNSLSTAAPSTAAAKPINMNVTGAKPIDMTVTGAKPIDMTITGAKPVSMIPTEQTPTNMNSTGQSPVDMNSPPPKPGPGEVPVDIIPSGKPNSVPTEVQPPEPSTATIAGSKQTPVPLSQTPPTDQTMSLSKTTESTQLNPSGTPISLPPGVVVTTRAQSRKVRDTLELEIMKARMNVS